MPQSDFRPKLVPVEAGDVPRFDAENGRILVLEEHFRHYKILYEKAERLMSHWNTWLKKFGALLHKVADEFEKFDVESPVVADHETDGAPDTLDITQREAASSNVTAHSHMEKRLKKCMRAVNQFLDKDVMLGHASQCACRGFVN